jgi:hypothetical protein
MKYSAWFHRFCTLFSKEREMTRSVTRLSVEKVTVPMAK